ncbi:MULTISPECIES: transcription antitermination factor NusB [Helcococcus]|uniref:Transcription antitermination factor NusB n=1 Tax=Helcococcus bovis TaxID=3153252 RepID=A0ABW9F5Y0_9FIRM
MNRIDERKWVIKIIFQNEFNEIDLNNLNFYINENGVEASKFIVSSLKSILNNIDEIDEIIKSKLQLNRKFDNILPIEKAILRVSINEFVIQKHVPTSVSINEAVECAKEFANPDSYKLINGILSSVAKDI